MLRPALVLSAALAGPLCRYTVRDVAFVDLGDARYRLHVFLSAGEEGASLRRLGEALALDANLDLEWVDGADAEGHPLRAALRGPEALPAALLEAPDGRTIELELGAAPGVTPAERFEAVVSSPARRALLRHLPECYAVAVLVEGPDGGANRRAHELVDAALRRMADGFDRMPKAVGDLPRKLVVGAEERRRERTLLFTLGIPEEGEVAVAVVYGRARRAGPVLSGAALREATLSEVLAVAGLSCECDLDRSWMRGPRVLARWNADQRARCARLLGFDPESPLVRAEVKGILASGPGGARRGAAGGAGLDELLAGYDEVPVRAAASSAVEVGAGPRSVPATAPEPPRPPAGSPWRGALWTGGGLLLASACGALFVLLRRKPA